MQSLKRSGGGNVSGAANTVLYGKLSAAWENGAKCKEFTPSNIMNPKVLDAELGLPALAQSISKFCPIFPT
eukprot:6977554-Pyramimonas_sp.AAC.1